MFRFCFPLLGEMLCVTSHGKLAFHRGSALRWVCVDSRRVLDLGSVNWREPVAWLMTFFCRDERSLKVWVDEEGFLGRLVVEGVWVRLMFGEEWVRSWNRFWYGNSVGELKIIGGETISAGEWGAVCRLGVVGTKLGPADGANDKTAGVEGVDVAGVDVRLVGGLTKPYDQLHWSWSIGECSWMVSWLCVGDCALALVSLVGTFDVGGVPWMALFGHNEPPVACWSANISIR